MKGDEEGGLEGSAIEIRQEVTETFALGSRYREHGLAVTMDGSAPAPCGEMVVESISCLLSLLLLVYAGTKREGKEVFDGANRWQSTDSRARRR